MRKRLYQDNDSTNQKTCPNSKKNIPDDVKFCPECGNELTCHDISVPVRDNNGQLFGVLSIVSAVIGLLILPVIFGVVAVNKNNKLGWIGIVIGGIITLITGIALASISNE